MGLLDSLRSMLSGGSGATGDATAYWVYVQCAKCGEALKVRVDRRYDLMQEFSDQDRVSGYALCKAIIGSNRCFQPINVTQRLDASHKVKSQEITNGRFLSKEEYESLAQGA
jgi:arginine/ornithine N-succinyltransferase beta subunit